MTQQINKNIFKEQLTFQLSSFIFIQQLLIIFDLKIFEIYLSIYSLIKKSENKLTYLDMRFLRKALDQIKNLNRLELDLRKNKISRSSFFELVYGLNNFTKLQYFTIDLSTQDLSTKQINIYNQIQSLAKLQQLSYFNFKIEQINLFYTLLFCQISQLTFYYQKKAYQAMIFIKNQLILLLTQNILIIL
ncbi:transmembrane protein, putative (macronuclear) [Tetrahymena thermophila SB210]|uniref:Transmembrane protein, putative n=1 Tax=Tetrahymena thermophila (strain SB210) TaxID=312017 RepID=W7XG15_TETTS|nr:transmembrane protein, putative [Tetrahymena thermophila SB210]EWS75833.1 transmembrane protein, putative [Tetrahymena thermophila SB210]|eukprot:XP_012651647.1 transmembrane protein, putative [Tetrahymena thermophila SB210]